MSHLRAIYEKLVRDMNQYNLAEDAYDSAKLDEKFSGKCGFTGQEINDEKLYQKYTYYFVRGISYECNKKTKDLYGNNTVQLAAQGFLPVNQQKLQVSVTRNAIDEFIQNQNKKAWIGNNIPVFIIILCVLINIGFGLLALAIQLASFFQDMPAGFLFSIAVILAIGIVLPVIIIKSYVSWFIKMRKIKKAGTDLSQMDKEQRKLINETIIDHVKKKISDAVKELWYDPTKDTSIIVDKEWTLKTHTCISRLDYRLMNNDMQEEINAILDNMTNAIKDTGLSEKIINEQTWQ